MTPAIGNRVRIVGCRHYGKTGLVVWVSGFSDLCGVVIDGILLGFAPGEIELIGRRADDDLSSEI